MDLAVLVVQNHLVDLVDLQVQDRLVVLWHRDRLVGLVGLADLSIQMALAVLAVHVALVGRLLLCLLGDLAVLVVPVGL